MGNRTSLYLDFKYELDNVALNNKEECDKSYHYMVTKLEEALANIDESISAEELQNILNFLQNSDNDLSECYFQIINILDKED